MSHGGARQTCAKGYVPQPIGECRGDRMGRYTCCHYEMLKAQLNGGELCRSDFCSSTSGDCCSTHGTRRTCAFGSMGCKAFVLH
eukprot:1200084-Amphidinium_carterae.1